MSLIKVDYATLKYNLYEILGINKDSTESDIKKRYSKLIKIYHPDKNSDVEEETYQYIMLAYQVLSNKKLRPEYDNFIINKADTFNELKKSFKKIDIKSKILSQDDITDFRLKQEELNKKHQYFERKYDAIEKEFEELKNRRNDNFNINKEDIKNNDDFNYKFEYGKNNQLIEFVEKPTELSTYTPNQNLSYVSLEDMDKLYIEDTIQDNKFTSLDRAFVLYPVMQSDNNSTLEERIKQYKENIHFY